MDCYVGEVRIFAGNFAPSEWADCNGQLLPVAQYSMLFSVIGNIYGGDGVNTFALPNLNGRAPLHQGAGPGLTAKPIGTTGGEAAVSLLESQMPAHSHVPQALDALGTQTDPTGAVWTKTPQTPRPVADTKGFVPTPNVTMSPLALAPAGAGAPHNNMQPYLPMRFIIALSGAFPPKQ